MKRVFTNSWGQEIALDSMRPSRILRHILEELDNSKDYLYLIMGKFGPTGKTWLCEGLKQEGYVAMEITEEVDLYAIYRDCENHYYVDPSKKLVIVVLNKHLV
jgi:hypothetical protein